jgi:hypothetical protein
MTDGPNRIIEAAIMEYVGAPPLEDKADVRRFEEKVFRKVGGDPYAALTGFGSILEDSLLDAIRPKWKEIREARERKGKGEERRHAEPGLGTYISVLENSCGPVNVKVSNFLHNLRVWRNIFGHAHEDQPLPDADSFTAQTCAIQILHYLVWRYECFAADEPEREPRSLADKRFTMPWGIQDVAQAGAALIKKVPAAPRAAGGRGLDAFGVAALKSRIQALSEVVAEEAKRYAALAAETYPQDAFTLLVPVMCDLRWSRGYLSALKKILKVPEAGMRLGDFACEEPAQPCPVSNGVLSAESEGGGRVLVMLDGRPALYVTGLDEEDERAVLDSVNGHGRLGALAGESRTLRQRIEALEVRRREGSRDDTSLTLYRNREALIPLIALFGMPGSDWLLPVPKELQRHEADFAHAGAPAVAAATNARPETDEGEGVVHETFLASRSYDVTAGYRANPFSTGGGDPSIAAILEYLKRMDNS